ncbi:endonuclease/exonuclease/phosphatase family domain-containing protein 1-like isoform X2 [Macrobrachium nipponense]|uniref:endonuclease/exonuclease/phosphatase family domain-containing protein 1-like isoform X2 n=1 Tax=Macrobrachium nipponense TaxID=159736 RepID=UPI0030C82DC5
MGQCTSGDLPPQTSDEADKANEENNPGVSPSSSDSHKPSSMKMFRRRSSNTTWVSTKFGRRHKTKDLSAAFNLLDYDTKVNLLNINTAPEEELMTLPGITRTVAKNIVEYRTAIGGFRRVEDLALVSGVGAAKLQEFKSDITVKKKSSSRSSSRTQSVDSLPSCESGRSQRSHSQSHGSRSVRGSPMRVMNVNTASIFELMNVRGMNQELAANIVDHRERKGPFRNIEDMIKVRGINSRVLSVLRVYLTVNDLTPSSPPMSDVLSVASYSKVYQRTTDGKMPASYSPCRIVISQGPYLLDLNDLKSHRRTHSAPLNNDGSGRRPSVDTPFSCDARVSVDFSSEIYELLSLRSERPIVSEVFDGNVNGRPVIRIATWNLQQLTKDKISNPGVLEVVCRTILENGFSLLAIQEVGSKDVMEKICSELNQSSLRRVREWGGPKGEWRWQVSEEPAGLMFQGSEYAAFIYNVHHGLQLVSASLVNVHSGNNNNSSSKRNAFTRKPYLGYFKANEFDFVVVSLHVKAVHFNRRKRPTRHEEDMEKVNSTICEPHQSMEVMQLAPLVTILKEKLVSERDIVLLGDFNMPPDDSAFGVLRDASYSSVVPEDTYTNISIKNSEGSCCCDNIWLNPHTRRFYTGNWGVIRQGLTHLAIPRGWGWGGYVSDHCPVYCDIYSCRDIDPEQAGTAQLNGNIGDLTLRDE